MNHRPNLSLAVLFALSLSLPVYAQHGSRGGHSGGHFSSGGFSGHSMGHSVGHSLGHMFGHRSGGRGSRIGRVPGSRDGLPPLAGAAFIHGKVVVLPGPSGAVTLSSRPAHATSFRFAAAPASRAMVLPNQQFDSGFCGSFLFNWHNFLFPGDFDCFGDGFVFDPVLSRGFIVGHSRSDSFITAGGFDALSSPLGPPTGVDHTGLTSLNRSSSPNHDEEASPASPADAEPPVTLLQLRDGSMYGLTRYWVERGRLHYVTNYGGENSLPFDRIDLAKTTELNAARGTSFVLPGNTPNP